jgi:hypothetical protein
VQMNKIKNFKLWWKQELSLFLRASLKSQDMSTSKFYSS